ncbi:hypothetical protein D3C87_1659870 [compost metagenome]
MKSGSLPEAISVLSFSFSFPAGTMKLMFTPVFFVTYWEVGSTPHLFGNQAKFRYQSNVIGEVSLFQPGSSAETADAAGSAGALVASAAFVAPPALSLPLFPALLPLEQPAAENASISPKSSSTIAFGLRFMPMLIYPFSKIVVNYKLNSVTRMCPGAGGVTWLYHRLFQDLTSALD